MFKLSKDKYEVLLDYLPTLPLNTLMARSIACGHADGTIYVDNAENPQTFYIVHSYGMSWLVGKSDNKDFNSWLIEYFQEKASGRKKDEWLQAYPRDWEKFMNRLVEVNTANFHERVNLKFNEAKFYENYNGSEKNKYEIVATPMDMLFEISGSVVPKDYWISLEKYSEIAKAFTVIIDDKPVSTAFTSARHDSQLEIGIETAKEFQGMGLAYFACAKLIEHCIDNHLEPVWSCRHGNTPSLNLSKKLGFVETSRMPYYHIPAVKC